MHNIKRNNNYTGHPSDMEIPLLSVLGFDTIKSECIVQLHLPMDPVSILAPCTPDHLSFVGVVLITRYVVVFASVNLFLARLAPDVAPGQSR